VSFRAGFLSDSLLSRTASGGKDSESLAGGKRDSTTPDAQTHNILDLCIILRELGNNPPLSEEESVFLTSIYRSRYPAGLGLLPSGEPSKSDAEKALRCASKIRWWFQEVFKTCPPDSGKL